VSWNGELKLNRPQFVGSVWYSRHHTGNSTLPADVIQKVQKKPQKWPPKRGRGMSCLRSGLSVLWIAPGAANSHSGPTPFTRPQHVHPARAFCASGCKLCASRTINAPSLPNASERLAIYRPRFEISSETPPRLGISK
jgi:hypothetical protein